MAIVSEWLHKDAANGTIKSKKIHIVSVILHLGISHIPMFRTLIITASIHMQLAQNLLIIQRRYDTC